MKYCQTCGQQLLDEAVICPHCGCAATTQMQTQTQSSGLKTAAKVFMVLGCIINAFFYLIPLCWCIPMTVHYFNSVNNHKPVGTGFKVCSLLFVSFLGGIFMLCDSTD